MSDQELKEEGTPAPQTEGGDTAGTPPTEDPADTGAEAASNPPAEGTGGVDQGTVPVDPPAEGAEASDAGEGAGEEGAATGE